MSIPLSAIISEQPDINLENPSLSFILESFLSGSGPTRNLLVSNSGPGNAKNISLNLPSGYLIWTNRCPSILKAGKSCSISLLNKSHRLGQIPTGTITFNASNSINEVISSKAEISTGEIIPPEVIADSVNFPVQFSSSLNRNYIQDSSSLQAGSTFIPTLSGNLASIEFGYQLTQECIGFGIPKISVWSLNSIIQYTQVSAASKIATSNFGYEKSPGIYKFDFDGSLLLNQNQNYIFVTEPTGAFPHECRKILVHGDNNSLSRYLAYIQNEYIQIRFSNVGVTFFKILVIPN